jgi:hypothetical protein
MWPLQNQKHNGRQEKKAQPNWPKILNISLEQPLCCLKELLKKCCQYDPT